MDAVATDGSQEPTISAPIGVFDSGFGGLTVARAVGDMVPSEDIVYLGDTMNAPYGSKTVPQVREYALACLDHLYDLGVKALVIACNTASSAVLRDARERYDVPVIDVIIPAAKRAVASTKNGKVGVICTEATANSGSYADALAVVPDLTLYTQPCPAFVDYVERGITTGPEVMAVAREYLTPLKEEGIDTLILGCTHYPLLVGPISYVMGESVTLVSSPDECAKETFHTLTDRCLLNPGIRYGERTFMTTGNADRFATLGRRLTGGFVDSAITVDPRA